MMINRMSDLHVPFLTDYNIDADAEYGAWVHSIDTGMLSLQQHPDRILQWDYMHSDEHAIARDPFYDWKKRRYGLKYYLALCAPLAPDHKLIIASHRTQRQGHVDKPEVDLAQQLGNHFLLASRISSHLGTLTRRAETLSKTFDRLDVGIAVVTRSAVSYVNAALSGFVGERDGLLLSSRGLTAFRRDDDARLQQAIGRALTVAASGASGAAIRITRPSQKRPFTVLVSPLQTEECGFFAADTAALIIVSDPERPQGADSDVLCRIFGFTPAEGRLAKRLLEGDTIAAAAESLGVTRNTIRTQLRALLAKTQTPSQTDLMRLLLKSLPPTA